MKNTVRAFRFAAVVLILAMTASCALPGVDGRTFLRLDWTTPLDYVDFPAFPAVINTSSYVEHQEGYYDGFYRIGSYAYDASYWITVEPGGPASEISIGDSGDWYYMSMWLYSGGPEMYTDYIETRSVSTGDEGDGGSAVKEIENSFGPERNAILASTLGEPSVVEKTWQNGDLTVHGRFTVYRLGD